MKLEDMVVTKFDTANGYLVENLPYVLESTETKERLIAVLKHNECDALTFYTWKGVIILPPADAKKYNIYKADLTDGMCLMFKDDVVGNPFDLYRLNQNFGEVVQCPINEKNCPPTGTIVCHRIIDYTNNDTNDALTTGIEYFYTVLAHVTVVNQFLYKVSREKDGFKDLIQYEIMIPVSESDKKYYMDNGWKIHPMFYDKENIRYVSSVRIQRPMQLMTFPKCDKDDSITLQILSGLQLLHLIEYGLNEKDKEEPGMYAGIDYTNNGIVISNAYTDEKNQLFINDEGTGIVVPSNSGYISKFIYWNINDDWLFFPKETTGNVNKGISDSVFTGPSMGVNNIIKWGSIDSDNFGMFNYWMHSTEASENDYIIPWEFGE